MSTPNFKHCNASKYYVFDYEDDLYNCQADLCSKGWSEEDRHEHDLNYPATIFASKTESVLCAGVEILITLSAKAVSGNYEAATFDYEAEFEVRDRNGYYVGQYDEEGLTVESVINDDFCANKGLSKIQAKNIIRKVHEALQAMKDEAEEVFSMYCEGEYIVAYSFGNGETGYKKIA